jgi:pyridoxamine 5'-phosphate oxidase
MTVHNSEVPITADQITRLFNQLLEEERKLTRVRIPTACCLSTTGTDGFPNARFVSLKEVVQNKFVVTGSLTSRKGREINAINKVALTFWWTETERQVRIQGIATRISSELADKYFKERNRDSQIVSIVSDQGRELTSIEKLIKEYENIEAEHAEIPLTRPENWGGYSIDPLRIEFLEFKPTRFHDRKLFEIINGQWTVKQLQP